MPSRVITNRKKSHRSKKRNGQAMIELALSLPFFLLIMVTILYFGRFFYMKQVVLSACQEGVADLALSASLSDPSRREAILGFDQTGKQVNASSRLSAILGSANLLSAGTSGDLPPGSVVKVLPYDADAADPTLAPGTVAVKITYPFKFIGSAFPAQNSDNEFGSNFGVYAGEGTAVNFRDSLISEIAVCGKQLAD
ncbi:MAG: pilus assembly protein [Candidatus Obscuribacter phosphatis]|uniref:Pilus assembly protein n=1 Tax=Candidatus Obscuribacter phosphatis TaxID=1906157 RepID=A0A8J7TN40_9BACT|nr:pilus assembly protein [Candidatus Obscuribacter phosphatis]